MVSHWKELQEEYVPCKTLECEKGEWNCDPTTLTTYKAYKYTNTTSLDGNTSMVGVILVLTASSFIDRNCNIPEMIRLRRCILQILPQLKTKKNQRLIYLHLTLQGLDIIDYLIKHQCFPNNLNKIYHLHQNFFTILNKI